MSKFIVRGYNHQGVVEGIPVQAPTPERAAELAGPDLGTNFLLVIETETKDYTVRLRRGKWERMS